MRPFGPATSLAAGMLAAVALGAACAGGGTGDRTTATPPAVTATPAGTVPVATATPGPAATPTATPPPTPAPRNATTTPPAVSIPVKVFFSKEGEDDPTSVYPVKRVSPTLGVARFAVEQLIEGPTEEERRQGYLSVWTRFDFIGDPACAGREFEIAIDGGTATIRFCRDVRLIGLMADAAARFELQATLTQFPNVDRAIILDVQGHCLFDLSGLDLCKEEPR